MNRTYPKLLFVTPNLSAIDLELTLNKALDSGIKWIQIRQKDFTQRDWTKTLSYLEQLHLKYDCLFTLNDHLPLALKASFTGVHLGKSDIHQLEEPNNVKNLNHLGLTINSAKDAQAMLKYHPTYFGLGPFAFTQTKEKLSSILGASGIRSVVNELNNQEINVPVYAIGGIKQPDIHEIIQTGVDGIACSGLIFENLNKPYIIKDIIKQLEYAEA